MNHQNGNQNKFVSQFFLFAGLALLSGMSACGRQPATFSSTGSVSESAETDADAVGETAPVSEITKSEGAPESKSSGGWDYDDRQDCENTAFYIVVRRPVADDYGDLMVEVTKDQGQRDVDFTGPNGWDLPEIKFQVAYRGPARYSVRIMAEGFYEYTAKVDLRKTRCSTVSAVTHAVDLCSAEEERE